MDKNRYYAALAAKELPKGVNRFLESVSETLAKRGFVLRTFGKGDQQSGSEPFERGAGTAIDRDEAAEAARKAYAEAHCNDWVKEYGIAGRFRTRDLAVNIFSRLVGPAPEDSVSFVLLWLDEEVANPVKDLGRMVRTAAEGLGFHTVDLGTLYRESLSLDEFKSAVAPTMIKACDARAPQALASPLEGDARAPQVLASPAKGDDAPSAESAKENDTPASDAAECLENTDSGVVRTIPDELREQLEGENGRAGAEQFMKGLERSLSEEPPDDDVLAIMF